MERRRTSGPWGRRFRACSKLNGRDIGQRCGCGRRSLQWLDPLDAVCASVRASARVRSLALLGQFGRAPTAVDVGGVRKWSMSRRSGLGISTLCFRQEPECVVRAADALSRSSGSPVGIRSSSLELARALVALPESSTTIGAVARAGDFAGSLRARLDRLTPGGADGRAYLLRRRHRGPAIAYAGQVKSGAVEELIRAGVACRRRRRRSVSHIRCSPRSLIRRCYPRRPCRRLIRSLLPSASDPEERGHHLAAAVEADPIQTSPPRLDAAAAHARARGAS